MFVNSNMAYRAIPDRIAYSASKSEALGMMPCAGSGFCAAVDDKNRPLGDIADFEDIGGDNSKNTTGAELTVDGGNMIQLYPIIPEK